MNSINQLWQFNLPLIIFLVGGMVLYLAVTKFNFRKQFFCFCAAIFLVALCFLSPLHVLGAQYLFSAHMVSHVILLLIAGPLFLCAVPRESRAGRIVNICSRFFYKIPIAAWLCGVVIMWFWHIPPVFHAMMDMNMDMGSQPQLTMQLLMILHPLSLLVAGILFAMPVLTPFKAFRLPSPKAILYLASACVCCSLLGLLITFAPVGTYTFYIMENGAAVLSFVRHNWDISAAQDQQMAGLIMWVPCCFIYLGASMVILVKWLGEKEEKTQLEMA